ncbi:MAG: YciI family protein [Gammaproteobacteria bacterium]|nr:YciI family protein [Gammaproteobacteria bacterium]MBL4727999.1 YciI family protein [Gammaproteobacteria bacterium]
MHYAIMSEDIPDSLEKRKAARPAHIDRLNKLASQDRLLVAGPHPAIDSSEPGEAGFSGSLVIAEFDSLDQAQAWADADPYVAAGIYQRVVVKPFKRVL